MSVRNHFLAVAAASACTVLLVTACSDVPTTSSPSGGLAPSAGPRYGYLMPYGCDANGGICVGDPSPKNAEVETLTICKSYPAGTLNTPAVQVQVEVKSDNAPRSQQSGLVFTVQPNSCVDVWRNGEDFGPKVDTVWVTELVPAGFTATSQVTTIKRYGPRGQPGTYFATNVNAPTAATTVKGYIGGYEVPGMMVEFTNTADAPPPPPSRGCTLTQGYWKNHEEKWPAPYSPTAPWLTAGSIVTGTTWDGLMSIAPKKGNSYVQLAHQWIAASLNKASGASVPATVQTTLDASGAWLLANTPVNGALPVISNAQATTWAGVLDDYNNGLTGPGHCD